MQCSAPRIPTKAGTVNLLRQQSRFVGRKATDGAAISAAFTEKGNRDGIRLVKRSAVEGRPSTNVNERGMRNCPHAESPNNSATRGVLRRNLGDGAADALLDEAAGERNVREAVPNHRQVLDNAANNNKRAALRHDRRDHRENHRREIHTRGDNAALVEHALHLRHRPREEQRGAEGDNVRKGEDDAKEGEVALENGDPTKNAQKDTNA